MMAFTALLYPALLGYLAVDCGLRNVPLPRAGILKIFLALPAGFGILSLFMFLGYGISPSHASRIVFVLATSLSSALIWNLSRQPPVLPGSRQGTPWRFSVWDAAAAAILVLALLRFLMAAGTVAVHFPHGEWDARLFWNAKAKFLLRSPELWKSMFSPLLAWAHPDYPLLLPATVAWGWQWCGTESILWPHLTGFVFALCMAGTVGWHLGVTHRPAAGFLAASVLLSLDFFRYWSASQYADIPLACLITQAAVLLAWFCPGGSVRPLLLAGFFAGLAAWTKNEGLFYAGFLTGAAVLRMIRSNTKWDSKSFYMLTSGISLPMLSIFILKYLLSPHGDYLGSGRDLGELTGQVFGNPAKTALILKGFWAYTVGSHSWNLLWPIFILSLAVMVFRGKIRTGKLFAMLALLQMAGYFLIIHVSPHPPAWQIETALTRLLLHVSGLVILSIFAALAPLPAGPD